MKKSNGNFNEIKKIINNGNKFSKFISTNFFKKLLNYNNQLDFSIIEFILYRFRWIFVLIFILPASIIFNAYSILRNFFTLKLRSGLKRHDQKVCQIQKQVIFIKLFFFLYKTI